MLVVIHTPDLQILLIERAAHPGFWQSVTGSLETGESLVQTACREVTEETGLTCNPADLRDWQQSQRFEIFPQWRHRYAPGVTENLEHVFSLCIPAPCPVTLSPGEHRAYRWLDAAAAAAACFSWSNRQAIEQLMRHTEATKNQ